MKNAADREQLFAKARVISGLIEPESQAGKMLYRNPCQIYTMLREGRGHYFEDGLGYPTSFCGWYEYDGFVEVGSTVTHPDHRGRGQATECLYRVLQSVQERGQEVVAFCNELSAPLFAKVGFETRHKVEMPAQALDFCQSCAEFANFPNCHCRYMSFPHNVEKGRGGIWHTLIENPTGRHVAECAEVYCGVWAEPPWDEYEWNLAEVESELAAASSDPATIFFASRVAGKLNGFTLGYPLNIDGLRQKCGGNQLAPLMDGGYGLAFYVAELGVSRESRHIGTGSILSHRLLEAAEQRGFFRFILRTDVEADAARALYTKLGFRNTGIADTNFPSRTYWLREC